MLAAIKVDASKCEPPSEPVLRSRSLARSRAHARARLSALHASLTRSSDAAAAAAATVELMALAASERRCSGGDGAR